MSSPLRKIHRLRHERYLPFGAAIAWRYICADLHCCSENVLNGESLCDASEKRTAFACFEEGQRDGFRSMALMEQKGKMRGVYGAVKLCRYDGADGRSEESDGSGEGGIFILYRGHGNGMTIPQKRRKKGCGVWIQDGVSFRVFVV